MRKKGKTALVLAGGGLTGAVYEIGALRAIDDLLEDRTVNDFDIFVGTSAGSLVAAFIANGLSPEEMLQVIDNTHPLAPPIERKHIFNLNWHHYLDWGLKFPGRLIEAFSEYLHNINDTTLFDLLWTLSGALPVGIYDPAGLETFVRQGFERLHYSNNFNDLDRDLYIITTDLDSGERTVFGKNYNDAPISLSIAASSALPLLYKPVRIDDKEYVDGGMRGNASLDIAIEQGATLIVCVNPLVPFDNRPHDPKFVINGDRGYLSGKGIQSVANQVFRIMLHSGLQYHIKQLRRAHPEVDIILIEPKPEDYQMFLHNIMHYSARLLVARHGFESVTLDLAQDYDFYKDVLERHGILISRRRVIEELAEISSSGDDLEVLQAVLEARTPASGARRRDKTLHKLDWTLTELEMTLNTLVEKSPV